MEVLVGFRRKILRLIAWVLYYSGTISLLRTVLNMGGDRKRIIIILFYHRVTDEVDFITKGMNGVHTSIANFGKHIRFLKKNYHLVSLKELTSLLKTEDKDSTTYITITFDDGFRDIYLNVFPLLQKYKIPATIFLITDYINANRLMWRHKQYYYKYYKKNINETEESNLANKIYLNWDEVKMMYENGLDIGAHTCNHSVLNQLPLDCARKEIINSKEKIEQMVGIKVKVFAYPFGRKKDFNEEIKEIVKNAGFVYACSTIEGANSPASDLYALKRIYSGNHSVSFLAMKLLFYELLTCR